MASQPDSHLYPNYKQPAPVFVRGRGTSLFDSEGVEYLDLFAGVAVSCLGHAHPKLTAAISEQAATVLHVSNHFYNAVNLELATALCEKTGYARALFVNSGTEAIEASLKLARRHFYAQGQTSRNRIIAFEGSFHGRTMGALAATGNAKYREGFGPLGPVTHVPFGDLEATKAAMGGDVAAILVEPIQGEGGVIPASRDFLQGLRELTVSAGALLILDEIQTGIGRTGTLLAQEHYGVFADVVALAKALGGGVPIGAMLTTEALKDALPPGTHGTTYGGNPLACSAALAVLRALEEEKLLTHVTEVGAWFGSRLAELAAAYPKVFRGARGRGLMHALPVCDAATRDLLLEQLRENRILVIPAGDDTLRFVPPLIITEKELSSALLTLERLVKSL
jgi:acetylornithine/N-succinyldiaminopimelate aminotransferase